MTPQEQQLLEEFLNRLCQAQGVAKDPQADALIHQRLATQPDAPYLLVQRAILLEQGLAAAKQQIAHLQQQVAGQAAGASFLGGAGVAGVSPPPPPEPPRSSWRERFFGGGAAAASAPVQPSFLASAATTAAGVAGGMFLAQGLEGLFGGHHGFDEANMVENVTDNNVIYENDPDGSGFDNSNAGIDYDNGSTDFDDGSWS